MGTLLSAWCNVDYKEIAQAELPVEKAFAADAKVVAFVDMLRAMTFLEAAYWLSSMYAMLSDENYRKTMAMFFTPTSLTNGLLDDLANQGVDFESQHFFDPACGGAAFLAPIAIRMRGSLKMKGVAARRILMHVESHLYGTDIDETLCELSRHFLRMALHTEICETGYQPQFKVHQADSLVELAPMFGKIDVVVCNPPYRKMASNEFDGLRELYDDVIEAQPNIYGLFIGLSVRLLKEGGLAALVTPTSFLSGQYFRKLRTFLVQNTEVAHIGMVSGRQGVFIDVEQETALTVFRRTSPSNRLQTTAKISVVSGSGQYENVGNCTLRNAGAVWPIPRSIEDVRLLKIAGISKFRFSDYGYRIRIGSYVWNRDKRSKYASISEVKKAKAYTALPLLWSRDISQDGRIEFDGEEMTGEEHRFVDLGNKNHRSAVTRPSVVLQRVTSNDQPRRLVAAPVPAQLFAMYGGFVGENHIVILEQDDDNPALNPSDMSKLLSTSTIDRYFRCISGAINVSAFELAQLALPDPARIKQEVRMGSSMDEAVIRSFGLN
ncbi:HsdM family class I SAM-dependent methyltransferase [Collimonas fungivorans]|uniref:HsdM family class I SAM-dependent methyltransferase n=1 Tax=Collimonas fungivorans TaxID=158899 RepID=UPI003FA3CA8F